MQNRTYEASGPKKGREGGGECKAFRNAKKFEKRDLPLFLFIFLFFLSLQTIENTRLLVRKVVTLILRRFVVTLNRFIPRSTHRILRE